MDSQEIIDLLSKGVDPITGKKLEADNILNKPSIIQALHVARNAIKKLNKLNLKSREHNEINYHHLTIEKELLKALKGWRDNMIKKQNLTGPFPLRNSTLKKISKTRPLHVEQLFSILDIERNFMKEHGNYIIDIVASRIFKETINCDFTYKCPLDWYSFKKTDDENIRFCDQCKKNVRRVRSQEEFDKYAEEGVCMIVPVRRTMGVVKKRLKI